MIRLKTSSERTVVKESNWNRSWAAGRSEPASRAGLPMARVALGRQRFFSRALLTDRKLRTIVLQTHTGITCRQDNVEPIFLCRFLATSFLHAIWHGGC